MCPDELAPYYVKKAEHLLSVAMILSIAESDDLVPNHNPSRSCFSYLRRK